VSPPPIFSESESFPSPPLHPLFHLAAPKTPPHSGKFTSPTDPITIPIGMSCQATPPPPLIFTVAFESSRVTFPHPQVVSFSALNSTVSASLLVFTLAQVIWSPSADITLHFQYLGFFRMHIFCDAWFPDCPFPFFPFLKKFCGSLNVIILCC